MPVFAPIKYDINGENEKTAIISNDFTGVKCDVAIYKPNDYSAPLPKSFINGDFEKFLYYPAYFTAEDEERLREIHQEIHFDGVYAENFAGAIFAQKNDCKIFAGTGWNLTNSVAVAQFLRLDNASYYAVSKELNDNEIRSLTGMHAFMLSSGNIKVMDLCYCPFGKTCGLCDKKEIYTLTDEQNRVFPVRRYVSANGNCRFEVFNCADLIGVGVFGVGKLAEVSLQEDKGSAAQAVCNELLQKKIYRNYTSGHAKRGVL